MSYPNYFLEIELIIKYSIDFFQQNRPGSQFGPENNCTSPDWYTGRTQLTFIRKTFPYRILES